MKNLFPIKKLDGAKGETIIKPWRCIFKSPNGVIIANCMLENELYKLDTTSQNHVSAIAILATPQLDKIKSYGTSAKAH